MYIQSELRKPGGVKGKTDIYMKKVKKNNPY